MDFTSFYEPQGALRGQKILKNGSLFRAGVFYKLLRATGRPPGAKVFEKRVPGGFHKLLRATGRLPGAKVFEKRPPGGGWNFGLAQSSGGCGARSLFVG